ncbi:MAG: ABC transporter permease [Bacteriovoracaceae bacterium]
MIKTFFRIIFSSKASSKFSLGVIVGLSFSISVILATFGIMDGFETSMKESLRSAQGNLYLYSDKAPFYIKDHLKKALTKDEILSYTGVYQTQGFILSGQDSKGVLMKGIAPNEFGLVTNLAVSIGTEDVALGVELAKYLKVKKGDFVTLAFGNKNKAIVGMPELKRLKVGDIVSHGIYEKDLRTIYINRDFMQKSFAVDDKVNIVLVKAKSIADSDLLALRRELINDLGLEFNVKIYWQEFSSLIEAVRVERFMIGLILQMVVVIAIFNVLAFIIFLNEERTKELFLIKALGFSQGQLVRSWLFLIFIIWGLSCALSILFVRFFNYALLNISFLRLPPEVYHLTNLEIILDHKDYLVVFGLAMVWLLIFSGFLLYRIKRRPILEGLRREFA